MSVRLGLETCGPLKARSNALTHLLTTSTGTAEKRFQRPPPQIKNKLPAFGAWEVAASAFVIQAVAEIFLKCDQNSFRVVQGRRFDDFLN